MSKAEQLIEFTTQDIVSYLVQDNDISMAEAMRRFYTSTTYEKLEDPETGLYLEGSAYVYSILKDEKDGIILQNEI